MDGECPPVALLILVYTGYVGNSFFGALSGMYNSLPPDMDYPYSYSIVAEGLGVKS